MKWDEDTQRKIWSRINFARDQTAKGGIEVLWGQMQHSIFRHEFLSLIHTCEQGRLKIFHQSERNLFIHPIERFKKIESFPKEVEYVSFYAPPNRDLRFRYFEKDTK